MRKLVIFPLALLAFILNLAGCATLTNSQSDILDTWLGDSQSNLIKSWGPPDSTADDSKGGRILTYIVHFHDDGYSYEQDGERITEPAVDYNRMKMFFANPTGKIYYWKWYDDNGGGDNLDSYVSKVRKQADQGNKDACYLLGGWYFNGESGLPQDYKEAIKLYTKAIDKDPKFAKAYCNRGSARNDMNDEQGALEDCSKAIELDPGYAFAYFVRGYSKNKSGDKQGALEDLNTAEKLGYKQANDLIKEIQDK